MIIVPEMKTVIIMPPKTASKSLQKAIRERFPDAFQPYRHMEADGVLPGYDRWTRIGFVRHPLERLWSLYKFLQDFTASNDETYCQLMRDSVRDVDFSDWLVDNRVVFTSPYDKVNGGTEFHPYYAVRHPLPENHKSQFVYLRPDLGTEILQMSELPSFARAWDLDMSEKLHVGDGSKRPPKLTDRAEEFMSQCHWWDYEAITCT